VLSRTARIDLQRAVAAILISLLAVACGSAAGAPPVSPAESDGPSAPRSVGNTQRSEGGEVTVDATWTGPAAGATFDIKLDTHSVDLDALDLADAVLRNDSGETLTARPWDAPKGGHHREGVLEFEGDAAGFLGGARWIELIISDVGELPERVLRWDVAP
jgi:hypothetical protein